MEGDGYVEADEHDGHHSIKETDTQLVQQKSQDGRENHTANSIHLLMQVVEGGGE